MSLSNHIKALRRQHITATDMPAILGLLDHFDVNAADIYWSKVKGIEPPESVSMEAGSLFERPVIGRFARKHKVVVNRRNPFRVHSGGVMSCTLDGIIDDEATGRFEIVEAKLHAMLSGWVDLTQWGEPMTDQVPDHYIVQATVQMGVLSDSTGKPFHKTWMPVFMPKKGFVDYVIHFNPDLWATLLQTGTDFWVNHVQPQVPPADSVANMATLISLRGNATGKSPNVIHDRWYRMYDLGSKMVKRGESLRDTAKRNAVAEMGDQYDEANTESGHTITWREQSSKRIDQDALRTNFPDAAAACTKVGTTRFFRTAAAKPPKVSKTAPAPVPTPLTEGAVTNDLIPVSADQSA